MKRPHSYISNTKALFILALSMIFLVVFDVTTGQLFKRIFLSSHYNFSRAMELTQSDSLILGSSTAARGIDPAAFDKVLGTKTYSFAKDGTGIFYATAVLRNIPKTQKIEYVIFGIDPASFVDGFSSSNFKQIERLLPYASTDALLWSYLERRIAWLYLKMFSLSYPYIPVMKEVLKDSLLSRNVSSNGFTPLNDILDENTESNTQDKLPVSTNHYEIAPESIMALKAIKTEVKKRNAKLILTTLPIYNEENRSRRIENSLVMSKIKSVLSGMKLCDLSTLLSAEIDSITFNNEMFYDSAHLNSKGSQKFAMHLAKKVKAQC